MHRMPNGVVELLDGLYLLAGYPDHSRSIPGYAGASVYLLRGPDGAILIDTGYDRFADQIMELLRSLGVAPEDIALVAYTHSHDDHVGSCERFRAVGARAAIHEAARAAGDWGGVVVQADEYFADGDVLEAGGVRLQVRHTPGHTPDSSCLLTEVAGRRVLFAGDLAGWFFPAGGSNYGQMVESVASARALGADLICGGHWLCDHELDAYRDKLSRSVAEGIFSLVDRFGAKDHYRATAEGILGEGVGS